MYNVHQYNSTVRTQQRLREEEQKFAKYLLRHEDYKEQAADKAKQKVSSFLRQQSDSPKPFVFEDDHFIRWRPNKQYRDVEDHTKFLSFKTFRHKPHYEMDKYYNERERKEIQELSLKKEHLVRSNVIPQELRSRSLRSHGPLNPKIEFREKKKDHEYLQPRLRFTNVTDRERQNQSAFSFDDKFRSLYSSFEMTKSKIGRTTVSPKRERYGGKKDALDFIEQANSELSKSKNFYYQKQVQQPEQTPSIMASSKMMSPQNSTMCKSGKSKTYFKLAKTLQLKSKDEKEREQIDQLLKRTQYERKKDLTNIRNNMTGQNYFKAPIL